MRISTNTIYEAATSQLGTLRSQMARTQMQLSTDRRILSPSDDPIASARVLEVTQSQSINAQFAVNRQSARSSLAQVDQALDGTTKLLQDVKDIVVKAGNGTLSPDARAVLATELEGRLDDLLGLANSADGAGGYLFSGYKSTTMPFTLTATGADYHGDQGQRQLQVGSSRQLPISDSGSSIFANNLTGNGTFQTSATAGNTGSGIVSSGVVGNAQQLTGHDYTITFAVSGTPATTSYTVLDNVTGAEPPPPAVAGPVPYQSGQPIAFDGVVFDIKGAPGDGDTFKVEPSKNQSVFETVTGLIAALRAPASDAAGKASLGNGLNTGHDNINAALDNVLSVQASVGTRMKELDYLDSAGDDINIQYETTLSGLQGLDKVKAMSEFAQQQYTLEAAQKSFMAMSGLSLFNYLR
jgi:flagellar hook-associated protein 3 FlgL